MDIAKVTMDTYSLNKAERNGITSEGCRWIAKAVWKKVHNFDISNQ